MADSTPDQNKIAFASDAQDDLDTAIIQTGEDTDSEPSQPVDVEKAARQGGVWSVIGYALTKMIGFASSIVLARLLMPEHFGLIAMVNTVIAMVQIMGEWGIWAAIIHKRENHLEYSNTGWWLDMFVGCGQFILANITAFFAAAYYGQPIVRILILVASVNYIINPIGNTMAVLLRRELQFKKCIRIDLTSSLVGSVFTIIFALLGAEVWSFIYPGILASITLVILRWRAHSFRPNIHVRWNLSKYILGYGKFMFGASIATYINENTDYILIGGLMGGTRLGLYLFAYNLGIWVVQNISVVITNFLFPTIAGVQDDHTRARTIYLWIIQIVSIIGFPLVALQWALAPLYIGSVYGEKWLPSVTAFRLIAVYGMGRAVCQPALNLISAMGRPDISFKISACTCPILVTAVFLGSRGGINGVALATAIAHGFSVWLYMAVSFRTLKWDIRCMFTTLAPAFVSSIIAGVVTWGLYVLMGSPVASLAKFVMLGMIGAIVYASAMFTFFRTTTLDIARLLRVSLREARE